ncbi:MAG: hypothetical protein IJS43_07080 [Bacteroidaceae bacterium]|nr:hypothetical protein [Bacteroidaceae bacterium]MBQ7664967.1 hypothetical protein [Bacteroidaceae bacterium]
MSILLEKGIIKKEGEISKLFEGMTSGKTFLDVKYTHPHEYIKFYWDKYQNSNSKNNSIGGGFFEFIIYTLLYREGILPFYTQAKVAFVPNIEFDTILYCKERPVCLSLKTSLRERYKQADLEAIALKYVHRKAQSYLLTLDAREAKATKAKIPAGLLIGLDDVIDCNTEQIDELITQLKGMNFCESTKIDVVEGNLVKH